MRDMPPKHDGEMARLAFDLAPSGMLVIGGEGTILLANRQAERIFGYEPGTLEGVPVDELVPVALRAGHAQQRAGFFAAASARAMGAGRDLSGLRRDGSEFPIEIGLNPVHTERGVVVMAAIVDITARREAERSEQAVAERVRHQQRLEALGTLAGGIAHDFNNVLLGIVGYTELAQRQIPDVPTAVEDLGHVLHAADRGRHLVRRMLAFARPSSAGVVPLALEPVVREAAGLLRASLPASIEMRVTVEPGLPTVLADETMIHQVVLNLGTNALQAMEGGGVLRVQLARAEATPEIRSAHPALAECGLVRLSVSDNGAGMTPEVRARAFEPYFTTKSTGKGTGLGLSVLHGIVQTLGGTIELHSEPGQGTRVDVWLPAAADSAGKSPADLRGGLESAGRARERHVLFVEDEPALAAMETRQFRELGLRVTVHTSSLEALEDFRTRPDEFDIMVTDNSMPGMSGMTLAKHVSGLRPALPILMVSGYAHHADPAVLAEHGVSAVLRKPHTLAELEAALQPLLPRWSR